MSRKQMLTKKVAHTLLAMSIVSASGLNLWAGTAWAAADGTDGNDDIRNGVVISDAYNETVGGTADTDGKDGTQGTDANDDGGNGGKGGNASLSGTLTVNDSSKAVSLTVQGGKGGAGGANPARTDVSTGNGGAGGSAELQLTVAGEVQTGALVLTASAGTGGAGGMAGEGSVIPVNGAVLGGGGAGGNAAAGIAITDGSLKADSITLAATAGNAGSYAWTACWGKDNQGSNGAKAGTASIKGLVLSGQQAEVKVANNIVITGTGGRGGSGGSNYGSVGLAAVGGAAEAYGLVAAGSGAYSVQFADLTLKATGGTGGNGGNASMFQGGTNNSHGDNYMSTDGADGGSAVGKGLLVESGVVQLTANNINITAAGGNGGNAGSNNTANRQDAAAKVANAGQGGMASATGIEVTGGLADKLSVGAIKATATGGDGGSGDAGGSAVAYGLHSSGGITILTADSITVQASGGTGGSGGAGALGGMGGSGGNGYSSGNNNGQDGTSGTVGQQGQDGQQGAQAEAYGVYAEKGAVITLSAKTDGGTITIGAKADKALATKAYAIYADNATVLFNDNAVLNSDGSSTDDTVITYLNNATLGFGTPGEGQNVGRTITGGTLQLAGSNTFKVATDFSDLANIKSDSFTFAKLAADSSTATQYITVGYDKAFDGSKLDSFVGDVTVLTITNLGAGQNLNNFVGKESEMDDPLTRFLATPTVAVDGNDVKITKIDFAEAGASESVMTAADAQMSIGNLWRIEGNNLMKRMGDLRSDTEAAEGGVWARYYRGEMSADSAYDRSFDQDYTAFQGGIDKVQDYKGGKLYTGIAVNRIDGNASYNSGNGDLSSTGVGVYASWLGSKGHYLDVIARGSKLANDFKLVDKSGNTAKGDYDTWAYGISAEYGYRQDLQGGWFVEPQAELSLGRIGSADYTMSNGTEISQDAVNSAVTRIGVLSGKEFTMNGRQGNAYLKASLLHDFGGNGGGAAYYNGRSTVVESADMNGTWYEIGLGANLGLAKNSNLYFDALKTFGGDLRTEWQFNAGLRFTF